MLQALEDTVDAVFFRVVDSLHFYRTDGTLRSQAIVATLREKIELEYII